MDCARRARGNKVWPSDPKNLPIDKAQRPALIGNSQSHTTGWNTARKPSSRIARASQSCDAITSGSTPIGTLINPQVRLKKPARRLNRIATPDTPVRPPGWRWPGTGYARMIAITLKPVRPIVIPSTVARKLLVTYSHAAYLQYQRLLVNTLVPRYFCSVRLP